MHKENIQTLVGQIQKDFVNNSEVCMAEYLAQFGIPIGEDITIADAFQMYIHLMKWAEGDKFYRGIEGDAIFIDEMEELDF